MNAGELLQQRRMLFEHAVRRDKLPERIPLVSNAWAWKVIDYPCRLKEGLTDYDKLYEIACEHHRRYDFDAYMETGTAYLLKVTEAFGKCDYFIDEENECLSYRDVSYMSYQDFPTFLKKGYEKYFWEDYAPRRFNWSSNADAREKLAAGIREMQNYKAHCARIGKTWREEFGVPMITVGRYMCPAEILFWGVMGMKGMSMAFRRDPDGLEAVIDNMRPFANDSFFKAISNIQQSTTAFDYKMTLMAHTIMNPKQFDRFYMPYMQEFWDNIVKHDKTAFIFIEGDCRQVMPHLQDIPKGHFAVLFENQDIFEAKKLIGDRCAIMGGFPNELLAHGTVDQCTDMCKKIMDEVAYDGGYIFCASKMQSFRGDADPRNLLAVNQFFRENNF